MFICDSLRLKATVVITVVVLVVLAVGNVFVVTLIVVADYIIFDCGQ